MVRYATVKQIKVWKRQVNFFFGSQDKKWFENKAYGVCVPTLNKVKWMSIYHRRLSKRRSMHASHENASKENYCTKPLVNGYGDNPFECFFFCTSFFSFVLFERQKLNQTN